MAKPISVALLGSNSLVIKELRLTLKEPLFYITQLAEDPNALSSTMSEDVIVVIHDNISYNDLAYIDRLRTIIPSAKIIVLDDLASSQTVIASFSVGVDGYLTNNVLPGTISGLIQVVALGYKIMLPHVFDALMHRFNMSFNIPSDNVCDLSAREREILDHLAAGAPNKIIARQLSIAEATVKMHVKAIMRKLNVSNRTQAAVLGMGGCVEHYSGATQKGAQAGPDVAHAIRGTTGPTARASSDRATLR